MYIIIYIVMYMYMYIVIVYYNNMYAIYLQTSVL